MTSTAIITGASSGIGEAAAHRLAQRGYRLILIARRQAPLEALAQQLSQQTACHVVPLDLADGEAVRIEAARLVRDFGPIEVLINNGGGGLYQPFLDGDEATLRRLMEVHYFSPAELIRAVLPGMIERDFGRIINVASIAATIGPWGHGGYAAAKSALITMTQSLAAEYGTRGVRFCYVNPGVVKTAFFEQPGYERMAGTVRQHGIAPDRVAKVIERLIDRPRLAVTEPRLYHALNWIHAISPAWAHRMVTKNSRPRGGVRG